MNQSKHLDQIFQQYHRAKLIYFKLDDDPKPIIRILYAGTACDGKMNHTDDAIVIDKEQFHLEASTSDTKLYINNSPQHADNNIYVVLQVRFEREKALAMVGLAYSTQEYDFDEIKRFIRKHCEPLLAKQSLNVDQEEKNALFEFDNGKPFILNGIVCKYLQRPLSYQKQRYTCLVILDLQQQGFELALFNCITFFSDPQLTYNYVYCIKGCSQSTFEVVTERTTLFKQINIVEDHGLSATYLKPGQRQAVVLVRTYMDAPGKVPIKSDQDDQGRSKSPTRLNTQKEAKSIPIKPTTVKFQDQAVEEQKNDQQQTGEPRPEIMKVAQSLQDLQLYLKQQNILTTIASKSPFSFDERRFCFACLGVETKMLCRTPLDWENGWTIVVFANPKAQGFAELIQIVEEQCSRVSLRFNRFVALQSISQAAYHSYGADAKFLRLKSLENYNIIFDENSLFGVLDSNFVPGTQCCFIADNNNNLIASAVAPAKLKPIFTNLADREFTQAKEAERLAHIAKAKNGRSSPLFKAVHRAGMTVPQ